MMVARDGIEPPTPALFRTVVLSTYSALQAVEDCCGTSLPPLERKHHQV